MIRNTFVFLMSGLSLVLVGCNKSSEPPPKAVTAKGDLMPAGQPGFEALYVADQKGVKLVAERTVSVDPLSTFRERNAEVAKAKAAPAKARTVEKAEAKESPKAAKAADKPAPKPKVAQKPRQDGKPGLFGRAKNAALGKLGVGKLLPGGGGAKPAAAGKPTGKPAKTEPAKKEKEKEEAEDEEGDNAGKDEGAEE
jgi:hypothetical protein